MNVVESPRGLDTDYINLIYLLHIHLLLLGIELPDL